MREGPGAGRPQARRGRRGGLARAAGSAHAPREDAATSAARGLSGAAALCGGSCGGCAGD